MDINLYWVILYPTYVCIIDKWATRTTITITTLHVKNENGILKIVIICHLRRLRRLRHLRRLCGLRQVLY